MHALRIVLALLTLLSAARCRAPADDGGVTLRFVSFKPDQPGPWSEAIRRFETLHPGVRVVREIAPSSSTAFHDLLTQKLKNRDAAVDVFFMDVVWPAEFAAAGWARALDDRFGAEEQADFLPGPIRANRWKGRIYGVPAFVDAGLLYYRKDLLERYGFPVPETWDELAERAAAIVDAERAAEPELVGYSAQLLQYEGLVCNMLELISANGGRVVDDGGTRATLTDPAVIHAVRWMRDRVVGGIAPRALLTYQEPESLALFLQGHAVFHRNWPYAWQVANDHEHSRVAGKVGLAALPAFRGGHSAATLGGWQYGISAESRHPEEAWAFVRHMSSAETQKLLAVEASLAPTRRALYEDREVLERNPQLADQAEALRRAEPRPVTPVYPAISRILQRFFSKALVDRESDVPALAEAAATEIDRVLVLAR